MVSYKDLCANCPFYEISGDVCTLAVQGMQCYYIELEKIVDNLMEVKDADDKRIKKHEC